MSEPSELHGLVFRFKNGKIFRIWKSGFEIGNKFGGKVYFFPWNKLFWRKNG